MKRLVLATLLLTGCSVFGPPTVTVPRAEVERAHVTLAYLYGRVSQWTSQKCAAKELTMTECQQARAVAEQIKAIHAAATERLAANPESFDAGMWLRVLEALLPLVLGAL